MKQIKIIVILLIAGIVAIQGFYESLGKVLLPEIVSYASADAAFNDKELNAIEELISNKLTHSTSINLASSDAMGNRNGVKVSGDTYIIEPGGHLFGTPFLFGKFQHKAIVQFSIIEGNGITQYRYYGDTPCPMQSFSQRINSQGEAIYYAEFVPSDFSYDRPCLEIRFDNRQSNVQMVIKDLVLYADGTYIGLDEANVETCYVSTNGNDKTGDGSTEKPYATVDKAFAEGAEKVIVRQGIYTQTIDLAKAKRYHITISSGDSTGRVIFINPEAYITGEEIAIPGYANVFSCSYSSEFDKSIRLYQEGIPDSNTLITDMERNPYQRGQEYRCFDTIIYACLSDNLEDALKEIEEGVSYKYYHDVENDVLYFSRPQTVTDEHPIMRSVNADFLMHQSRNLELSIYGIECKYMRFNVSSTVFDIKDCKCSNAFGSGCFVYGGCLSGEFVRCEASGAYSDGAGDGFNAHSISTGDIYSKQTTVRLVDCWSHDCADDGYSDHERSETEIWGGLFEYNGKAGVTPSSGSHCSCFNVISRNNYNGFLYKGEATEEEGGKYGQLICFTCIAENNHHDNSGFGFAVQSDGNSAKLINCKSIGNKIGYYCGTNTSMELIDCGTLDNEIDKVVDGMLYVNNTNLIAND